MKIELGLMMLLCLLPFLVIMFLVLYPKKWRKRKYIFGVRNRDEFKTEETEKSVDEIVQKIRRMALVIYSALSILAVAMLLIPNQTLMLLFFTIYVFVIIFVCMLPYVKGNSEIKSLKRELGIKAKGVKIADLRSINASHALNMPMLLIPNILTVVCMIFALLYDFNLIGFAANNILQGSYAASISVGSFLFVAVLFVMIAKMMDSMRNEVISEESDVNINYNRAKKKIWSDTWIQLSWINTITAVVSIVAIMNYWTQSFIVAMSITYIIAVIVVMVLLARNTSLLNKSYDFKSVYDDDDDAWIYGLFYYNPSDKRLNVEKRDGMGTTINMAHPVGKVFTVVIALVMLGSVGSIIWAAALDFTALDVRVENGYVICHQLRDDYVIPIDEIKEVSLVDSIDEIKPVRIAGVQTEKVYKGQYSIVGEKKAKLFMNPKVDEYIKIKTDKTTYIINGNSETETHDIFDAIEIQ
ncbi:MAG: hypothetical protein IKS48_08150 [Eubacterium sp.]|nr:hypothetical protein [Eubacterium sp.]